MTAKTVRYVTVTRWTDLACPPPKTGRTESIDLDVTVYTTRVLQLTFYASVREKSFIGHFVLTACAVDLDVGLIADVRIVVACQTYGFK